MNNLRIPGPEMALYSRPTGKDIDVEAVISKRFEERYGAAPAQVLLYRTVVLAGPKPEEDNDEYQADSSGPAQALPAT